MGAILSRARDMGLASDGDIVVLTGAVELSVPGTTTGVVLHRLGDRAL